MERHEAAFPTLLRRSQVEQAVGLSRATIYRLMADDEFPAPIRVGKRAVRWKAEDLRSWLESRQPTGDSAA